MGWVTIRSTSTYLYRSRFADKGEDVYIVLNYDKAKKRHTLRLLNWQRDVAAVVGSFYINDSELPANTTRIKVVTEVLMGDDEYSLTSLGNFEVEREAFN